MGYVALVDQTVFKTPGLIKRRPRRNDIGFLKVAKNIGLLDQTVNATPCINGENSKEI